MDYKGRLSAVLQQADMYTDIGVSAATVRYVEHDGDAERTVSRTCQRAVVYAGVGGDPQTPGTAAITFPTKSSAMRPSAAASSATARKPMGRFSSSRSNGCTPRGSRGCWNSCGRVAASSVSTGSRAFRWAGTDMKPPTGGCGSLFGNCAGTPTVSSCSRSLPTTISWVGMPGYSGNMPSRPI